jgi:MFS family permease
MSILDTSIVNVALESLSRDLDAPLSTIQWVGAALFGSLLLLPLYFQIARDLSPLQAGLLIALQGLGAALGMNRAGRLTDRIGGGPVAVAGLFALMLGAVAFTLVDGGTPYWVLELSLFVRGIGRGSR